VRSLARKVFIQACKDGRTVISVRCFAHLRDALLKLWSRKGRNALDGART
jgi:hypothetical protein